jgi:ATP-binding cassette subfamily B protein
MEVINNHLSIGELLQFSLLVTYLMFPVLSLGWVMSLIQQGISAMKRINHILDQESMQTECNETTWISDTEDGAIHINLQNLSYSYSGSKTGILKDLTMTMKSGEIIGMTGPIGSGKSTLLHILSGLLPPGPDMFFMNNVDVAVCGPMYLFSRVAFVPQQTFLFSKTLAENIGLSEQRDIDMERVRYTADMAGLTGDIKDFPDTYQQIIGERGINISGGQRQRIAIARALYKESPILILDDSFSSVDSGIEEIIIKNLTALPWIKILIIASHRLSSLQNADCIYVLERGAISEKGSHASLLQEKGTYARLAAIQQLIEG